MSAPKTLALLLGIYTSLLAFSAEARPACELEMADVDAPLPPAAPACRLDQASVDPACWGSSPIHHAPRTGTLSAPSDVTAVEWVPAKLTPPPMRRFGFGDVTGLLLPGHARRIERPPRLV